MLEGIGAYLINYYLGEFLEDINNDQLSVQLLSGDINLSNVPIRKGASERFGLPIYISGGNVKNIKIRRPNWTRLLLDPFEIEISGLHVEIQPTENRTKETSSKDDLKFRRIQSLISRWLAVGQQQGIWAAYSSQIISDIVQNIKVTVADVSIIYRDSDLLGAGHVNYSVPHIQVANVPAMTGFARKRLLLQDLEIVWHKTADSFTHLMEPVEATIDIVKNKSVTPLNNSNPRFKVDLTIEGVSFQLSDKQHSIIYSTWEKLEWFYRKQRYSELRPSNQISSVEDSDEKKKLVKSWWKWVLHHTARPIQEYRRTKTKPYLLERIGQLNKYSNIIAKLLKKIELSEEDKASRIEIETLWTYDECRTVIYAVVDKFYSKKPDTTEGQEGMISWMMRGGGLFRGRAASTGSTQTDKSESDESKSSEAEDTPDPSGINLPKLSLRTTSAATNQYFQDHSVTNDTFLTRDNVFADFSFRLKNGTLKLTIDDGNQLSGLSTIEFNGLQSSLGCRFRAESFTYITELADFKIIDDFTKDSIYPVLVSTIPSSKGNNSNNSKAMFHFSYEKENLYQRIYCETAPLQMIYNKKLMDIGKGFLNLGNGGEDSLYNWRQRERYRGVKEEAKRNISKALTKVMSGKSVNAGGVHVTLDLSAPKILLPQSFKNPDTPQIMIDLGKIKFSNVDEKDEEVEEVERFFTPGGTPPPEEEESTASHEEMPTVINAQELQERLLVSKIYHKYSVQLLDLQILVGTKNDTSWRSASAAKKSSMHIVEPFNVSIGIEKRAFDLVDDTKYPMIMVSGSLPSLMLQINESKSSIIFSCLDTCLDHSSTSEKKAAAASNHNETLPDVELKSSESENLRKLIVIMFQIERVSCGLYSVMHNDQMVAGLEVTRIKANVKLQPEKSHVKLSVGSVVVTNNHEQHLGNDFQSILVSNRNATLDIPSGTIIDSGCTSPTIEEQLAPTPPNFVSQLQENLNKFWNSEQKDAECQSSWSLSDDASEELAVLEWTHYDESQSADIGDDIHVTFSSLDIVITPDTLSVLLHLLHRLKPAGKKPKCDEEDEKTDNNNKERLTVLHFEMRTINLMVGVADNGIGRKIATAGIEEFRSVVQIQNPGNVTISGKIGSIFGSDLSFANDLLGRRSSSRIFALGTPKIKDLEFDKIFDNIENDAFSFDLQRCNAEDGNYKINVEIETASLCYIHSPQFLGQVFFCMNEFKAQFDEKLTLQAQERYQQALSGLYEKIADVAVGPAPSMADFRMKMKFKSPFVVLPKQSGSSEMLLAKIGSIYFENQGPKNFSLEIKDGAVSSVNNNIGCNIEPRGLILDKTDVSLKFNLNDDKISVTVALPAKPVLSLTKMNYEQILKTLDNIAIPEKEKELDVEENKDSKPDEFKPIYFMMHIPSATINMTDEAERNSVKFIFYDFWCNFQKVKPTFFDVDLALGSIEAIDAESPDQYMLRSRRTDRSYNRRRWKSCPYPENKTKTKRTRKRSRSISIADLGSSGTSKSSRAKYLEFFRDSSEPLVKININQTNLPDRSGVRKIKILFSRLDAGINLQTWVTLIDFLTPSSAPLGIDRVTSSSSQSDGLTAQARHYRRQVMENQGAHVDTWIDFEVENFTIIFNKPEYQFSKVSVQKLSMKLFLWEKTHRYEGSIGELTLYDLSPAGYMYRERFVTDKDSKEILNFHIFRYCKPDFALEREFDLRVKIRMSQIMYIHTHRFQSELTAYFLHFHQLLELVNHYRAAMVGAEVTNLGRGSRVKLDITADNPTLILPESSYSPKVIIADLGKLSISNTFKFNDDIGTLHFDDYQINGFPLKKVLLDCITVDLKEMDIWIADRVDLDEAGTSNLKFHDFKFVRHEESLLKKRVKLSLAIERNLQQNVDRSVPDMHIDGTLSKAHFVLNRDQFWVVRDFLEHNLGEMQPIYARPSVPVNIDEAMTETVMTGEVFRNLKFRLGLKNVTVELGEAKGEKLVKMEFVNSTLNFEALSNNHKHTNLVCKAYNAWDCRELYNIHPSFQKVIAADLEDEDICQIEIVFKATPDGASFKLVTEKTRIIVLPEWSKQTLSYLLEHPIDGYGDDLRKINYDLIRKWKQEPSDPKNTGEKNKMSLDITTNVHGTEFLIINDLTSANSAAIILRSTAVLHKNDFSTVLSLQCLELFSLELTNEDQTSLSILDPTSLSLEYSTPQDETPKLEISFDEINARLSYTDFLLIRSIGQNIKLTLQGEPDGASEPVAPSMPDGSVVRNERGKEITYWRPCQLSLRSDDDTAIVPPKLTEIQDIEAKLNGEIINMTFIDDSGERDIPLITFEFKQIQIVATNKMAQLHNKFIAYLYNQDLSIWDPLVEPYDLMIRGDRSEAHGGYNINLLTQSRLNLNVTTNFFHLVNHQIPHLSALISGSSVRQFDVRRKFRPYTLDNATGIPLSYSISAESDTWRNVAKDSQDDFTFARSHQKIREYKQQSHRIWIKIGDWFEVQPIAVNRVGTFFRHAIHKSKSPIRIIIEVRLTESARKMVTIRSAIKIFSKISVPIEVFKQSDVAIDDEYENTSMGVVEPNAVMHVPLQHADSRFVVRPADRDMHAISESSLCWRSNPKGTFTIDCLPYEVTDRKSTFNVKIEPLKLPHGAELTKKIEALYKKEKLSPSSNEIYHVNFQMPGHNIYLYPGIKMRNQLPCEIQFYLSGYSGTIQPHKEQEIYFSPDEIRFKIRLEGFESSSEVYLSRDRDMLTDIRIVDQNRRLLILNVRLTIQPTLQIVISSRYWLINHTSLPLVLRQSNSAFDAAGQFDEHESARCRTPLLFSYSDRECPFYCQLRLGSKKFARAFSHWTSEFSLEDDCHREIQGAEQTYQLGISVRNGTEDYRDTKIVTFTPRFTIQNSTPFNLNFAQQYLVFGKWHQDPEVGKFETASPGASCNFDWPDIKKDKVLCLRITDPIDTRWSGGFPINVVKTSYLNVKFSSLDMIFLEVSVSYHAAMFFVEVREMKTAPLIRIDNLSAVPVSIIQEKCRDNSLRAEIPPDSSMPYICDEPMLPEVIWCSVKSGKKNELVNLEELNSVSTLYYENLFYIESRENLVLDVDASKLLFVRQKDSSRRSQLWRTDPSSSLINAKHEDLVLDPITMKLIDPKVKKRRMVSKWSFENDVLCSGRNRLYLNHLECPTFLNENQLASSANSDELTPFVKIRQNKGSGQLHLRVVRDGPRRVLQIYDILKSHGTSVDSGNLNVECKEKVDRFISTAKVVKCGTRFSFGVDMPSGIGISVMAQVIPNRTEEFFYLQLTGINIQSEIKRNSEINLTMTIFGLQCDHQIHGAYPPVILEKNDKKADSRGVVKSVLAVTIATLPNTENAPGLFRLIKVETCPISFKIDEGLILRMMMLIDQLKGEEVTPASVFTKDPQSLFLHEMRANATKQKSRYYCEEMLIKLDELHCSLYKQSELPAEIKYYKSRRGIPLVQFEDARINIDRFYVKYYYKDVAAYQNDFAVFIRACVKNQAFKVLGSVDFLGNPLGLAHDIKDGLQGVLDGNLTSVMRGTTRGLANSASKFVGSVADVVSSFAADREYEDNRRRRKVRNGDEFGTVVDGLAYGVLGGVTSIADQTYKGVKRDGATGFFSGFGKGVMGTIIKPMTGVLDFATGTASLIRDRADGAQKRSQSRKPRVIYDINGGLPEYEPWLAEAQEILFSVYPDTRAKLYFSRKIRNNLDELKLFFVTESKVIQLGLDYEEDYHFSFDQLIALAFRDDRVIFDTTKSRPKLECTSNEQAEFIYKQVVSIWNLFKDEQHTLLEEV